jgi:pyrroloquinoline-quinone synthase
MSFHTVLSHRFTAGRKFDMSVQPRLLDHPFYQEWSRGEVSTETLAVYHRSYAEFIQRIPSYWQTVVNAFQPELPYGSTIVQEERDHIVLWETWGRRFPRPDDVPSLREILLAFETMTPSQLLGAIQAFEMQQPEVAATKIDGLVRYYGFAREDLKYFDVHLFEERHVRYGRDLAERYANRREFEEGFARGAELVYRSLDAFVSG